MDDGDFVVVKNIEQAKFTGKKFQDKKYYRHTGYPGGIKETSPEKISEKKPEDILKLAVKRMLPGGPLAKKQLSKLKIYIGENHPHTAQNPEIIEIKALNNKNIIRNLLFLEKYYWLVQFVLFNQSKLILYSTTQRNPIYPVRTVVTVYQRYLGLYIGNHRCIVVLIG